MNRQYRLDISEEIQMTIMRLKQHRNHRTLPIMTMYHIRLKVQIRQSLDYTSAEKTKTLRFIAVTIQTTSFEIIFAINKIKGNSFILQCLDAKILCSPTQSYIKPS
ncbi:hypothetical protein D3C73_946410 [compost metagenome]